MRRVILLKGASQYEGTRVFIDGAAAAFARRGFEPVILDLAADIDGWRAIQEAAHGREVELVFSINICGGERPMEAVAGAPHVTLHVDYVLSQRDALEQTPASAALLAVDPTQVDAVRALWGAERFAHVGFCPHAAVGSDRGADPDAETFVRNRSIDVLFCGTFYKPDAAPWRSLPPPLQRIFQDAVDLALAEEWTPPLEALDRALAAHGRDPLDPANLPVRKAAHGVDRQVRLARRFEFLKALAKTGLRVHIHGRGWETQLYRFRHAVYGGEVPMDAIAGLMRQARVVVNTNGNFGGGSHERPLSALLAGAAAVTDASTFYDAEFAEDAEITLYRWKTLDAGMQKLARLVQHPETAWAQARAGNARVAAKHTWDNRLDVILGAAEVARRKWSLAA